MAVRIYKPARNAMQSGKGKSDAWVLEFEATAPRTAEPLMGWTASSDMRSQISLEFDTLEEAVAYAERHAIPHQVFEPHKPVGKSRSYSDNFRFDRKTPWTH